jgi:colanic acid biosynthesis glycosyl transferase WcaI
MRRLVFVNRFFFPDHSATSQILSDLAFHLAASGTEVHVLTSSQRYDAPKASLPPYDIINGVRVHRVSSTTYGRGSLLGRLFDYLSFYLSVRRSLMRIVRQGDVLVSKTDPPLLSLVIMAVARRKQAVLINWLQDLYPEVAQQLGVPLIQGPVAAALVGLRNRSLCAAAANVTVGRLMAAKVERLGVSPGQIHVIANWCHDAHIRPVPPAENPLRREWGLHGKFVFGYSGNLGRGHEFETVLAAAELLRNETHLLFLVIGGGKHFDGMRGAVTTRALTDSFRFMPYQDQRLLAYSLGASDAHWVSLNPKLEGLIVPSKFYGIAAAGRPIVVIGAKDGELASLIEEHCCGFVIAPGDAAALAAALRRLASDESFRADMGTRIRKMLDTRFGREVALAQWCNLLKRLESETCDPLSAKRLVS